MDALPGVWVRQDGSFQYITAVWRCGDPEAEYERYTISDGGALLFKPDEATGQSAAFKLSQIKAIVAYIEAETARARAEGRIS